MSHTARPIDRVVLVVLDGLRPDAIDRFALSHIAAHMSTGAWTRSGRTVEPSITVAAMASLLTGVPPARHGVRTDGFRLSRRREPLDPLPVVLAEAGYPCSAFLSALPAIHRVLVRRVLRRLGPVSAQFTGRCAEDILAAASGTLRAQRRGLVLLHWPDADDAGHDHGWMSAPYAAGARALDGAVGALSRQLDLAHDPTTLLVLLADHGGGGYAERGHESDHPADYTIPTILAGAHVRPGPLPPTVSLLDIPATVLWSLGVPLPESYAGRPLREAFTWAHARGADDDAAAAAAAA
jgi:arylsulfatase A-like enzyme